MFNSDLGFGVAVAVSAVLLSRLADAAFGSWRRRGQAVRPSPPRTPDPAPGVAVGEAKSPGDPRPPGPPGDDADRADDDPPDFFCEYCAGYDGRWDDPG